MVSKTTEGEDRFDGTVVNDVKARNRDVAMVFQDFALYPHMEAGENLGFSLHRENNDQTETEIDDRVQEVAEMLVIEQLSSNDRDDDSTDETECGEDGFTERVRLEATSDVQASQFRNDPEAAIVDVANTHTARERSECNRGAGDRCLDACYDGHCGNACNRPEPLGNPHDHADEKREKDDDKAIAADTDGIDKSSRGFGFLIDILSAQKGEDSRPRLGY